MAALAMAQERATDDGRMWFVLQTKWNKELVAVRNLRRDGFECYLPMHLREIRPRGQPARLQGLPLFPRYTFVSVDRGAPGWRTIYTTEGVSAVLPSCAKSSAVLAKLIADLQAAEDKGYVQLAPDLLPCPFKPGDKVTYGAFREAIFHERVDERRCLLLVSLLGTDLVLTADVADIE